jgi:4-hydroxy-3-methylbut-2-enyl diphosphate reductase
MPEAIIAENAGFCPGVRAATVRLQKRIDARVPGERIFTLGHLIHNEDYNAALAARGVVAVSADELEALAAEAAEHAPVTVFIRAHGITLQTRELLARLHEKNPYFDFVDCTCVFVEKIHRIASEKNAERDRFIFVCLGSAKHPEVEGFMSCFEGEKYVFATAEELEAAFGGENRPNFSSKVPVLVAQTTQKLTEWKKSQKLL